MAKRFLLFCLLLVFVLPLAAQQQRLMNMPTFDEKRLHFGFTLGVNSGDFVVANNNSRLYSDVAGIYPGFSVGMVSNLRLGTDFDLRFLPGLSLVRRPLTFNEDIYVLTGTGAGSAMVLSENPTVLPFTPIFLDFPLHIKYKARRINNGRPYLTTGPAFRYDLNTSQIAVGDKNVHLVDITKGSFYYEIGTGWDTYFTFFRFSVEAKVSLGLGSILKSNPPADQLPDYHLSMDALRSNLFSLLFHFE